MKRRRSRSVRPFDPPPPSGVFEVGELAIDPLRGVVFRCGERLDLTPRELEFVALLARRAGTPVPRAEILEAMWPEGAPRSNVLEDLVRRLRRKFVGRAKPRWVHLVRGVGYLLEDRGPHRRK